MFWGHLSFFRVARTCAVMLVVASAGLAQQSVSAVSPTKVQPDTAAPAQPDTRNNPATEPRIAAGDLVQVTVYGVPDLTQTVRISGSGTMPMPLIGEVRVAGLTSEDASKQVRDLLASGGFVKNPSVSVFVKEYSTQGASIMGEVVKPGVYPILGARRLFDVISAAQGLSPKAGKTVTITRRDNPTEPITVALSSDPAKSMNSNVEVFPGDTIVVSKAGVVFVVGEVGRPGGFVLDKNESLTLLQALALAEGAKPTAALSRAKLIRREGEGHKEISIAMQKVMQAKDPDIALQPDDILFIPASFGKSAARRGIDAALQTAIGVAIYRP